MTYATDLAAASAHDVRLTLFIDGLPALFGTRAGLVHSGDSIDNATAALVSNDGLDAASVSLEAQRLDIQTLMIPPGSASASVRIDPAWDCLFMRRSGVEYRLAAQVSENATTWALNTTAGLSGGAVLYCNRETVQVTAVLSGTEVQVTRNAYALAAVNRGGQAHSTGAIVSTAPRYLLGRACELRAWLGVDQSTVLRLLYLNGSPEYDLGSGRWMLSFDDAMRLLDRKVAVGFGGTSAEATAVAEYGFWAIVPTDQRYYSREFAAAADNGHLALWDAAGNLTVEPVSWAPTAGASNDGERLHVATIGHHAFNASTLTRARRCYVFSSGRPMELALKVLLSDRGLGSAAGANHAIYDVLLGWTATGASSLRRLADGDAECRMGAAIPAAFVDIDALEGFLDEYVPGFYWVLGLSDEESLLDVLEEVAWALAGHWYVTPAGQLSFRRFSGATADAAATVVDRSVWLHGSSLKSVDDESEVLHTVSIKCNKDPQRDDFLGTVNVIHAQTRETYRDVDGRVQLERRSLYVDLPAQRFDEMTAGLPGVTASNLDAIRTRLNRVFVRRNRGVRKYSLALPWTMSGLRPGDRLSVTSDVHVDFAGGTLANAILEVTGVQLDPISPESAKVAVDCHDAWTTYRVSPTAVVASVAGATITLATSTKWDTSATAATPGRWFAAGWKVRFLDASAGPAFSQAADAVVASVTDTTVVLVAAPTFSGGEAIAAGDLLVQDIHADADSAATNGNQALGQRDYVFGADDALLLDAVAPYTYG